MAKGTKICPDCKKGNGVRQRQCECGHNFSLPPAAITASPAKMSDPLNQRLAEPFSASKAIEASSLAAKTILKKVESRSLTRPEPWANDKSGSESETTTKQASETVGKVDRKEFFRRPGGQVTYVPAEECPFKPEGYKKDLWYNYLEVTPDDIITNWAIRVFNSGTDNRQYHPHAVVYWAKYYWEMNDVQECNGQKVFGEQWRRVRDLILSALMSKSDHEAADSEV